MDYTSYTDKAKVLLAKLFEDEKDRNRFVVESLDWAANSREDETGRMAFTLMMRVTGGKIAREEVLRIHVDHPEISRPILDADYYDRPADTPDHSAHGHLIAELKEFTGLRVLRNLAPMLDPSTDIEEARACLANRIARMRRRPSRMAALDGVIAQVGEKLLQMLADPSTRGDLERIHGEERRGGSRRVADAVLDLVLPSPMPREMILGLLAADDKLGEVVMELDLEIWAREPIAAAIERENRAELQRFFDLHFWPDPGYPSASGGGAAAP